MDDNPADQKIHFFGLLGEGDAPSSIFSALQFSTRVRSAVPLAQPRRRACSFSGYRSTFAVRSKNCRMIGSMALSRTIRFVSRRTRYVDEKHQIAWQLGRSRDDQTKFIIPLQSVKVLLDTSHRALHYLEFLENSIKQDGIVEMSSLCERDCMMPPLAYRTGTFHSGWPEQEAL